MKNSFVLYTEYAKHLSLLSMEQRGVLFTAIMAYELGEELPDMDGMTQMAFSFISEQLSRDKEKYESTCKKRSEAGSRGGRPRANESNEKQDDPREEEEKQAKANESDKKQENETAIKKKQEPFAESKKSNCFLEKANKSNEKQKNPDNEDEDEYEDEYEDEEDMREVEIEGECEREKETSLPHSSPPSSPPDCINEGLALFLRAFPNVVVDNRASPSLDLDYEALTEAFEQSSWLRKRGHDLSWVARNAPQIIQGRYKDHESIDVYGDLRRELMREDGLNDA